jgi:hypothetical protein
MSKNDEITGNGIFKSKEEIKENVISITNLHPSKIRNIYVFGSRVYGTYRIDSDYDIIVVACSVNSNVEFRNGDYNIHVTTPDIFEDQLIRHNINNLECIFAPSNAQIYQEINYNNIFKLKNGILKKSLITQSTAAWLKGRKRIESGNIIGGAKSLFHSIRILDFGIQIIKYHYIKDFSSSNHIWKILDESECLKWEEYDNLCLGKKKFKLKELKEI